MPCLDRDLICLEMFQGRERLGESTGCRILFLIFTVNWESSVLTVLNLEAAFFRFLWVLRCRLELLILFVLSSLGLLPFVLITSSLGPCWCSSLGPCIFQVPLGSQMQARALDPFCSVSSQTSSICPYYFISWSMLVFPLLTFWGTHHICLIFIFPGWSLLRWLNWSGISTSFLGDCCSVFELRSTED